MLRRLLKRATSRLDPKLIAHARSVLPSGPDQDRLLFLQGQIASKLVRQMESIDTLADVEFQVSSQWGEDGIIDWLCHKLPEAKPSFVEFGVENFREANTRFLLKNRAWSGLILDGNPANMAVVRKERSFWRHDLVPVGTFITTENINSLIKDNGFSGELGLLSIDIDGNDYWVLKAIDCVRPAILIAEVNGVLGDRHAITVPYDPAFERLRAHYSGQYFGASTGAMIRLAGSLGYSFVGTNSAGVNAFFIRNDLADRVVSSIKTVKIWPARHRDSRDPSGNLSFARGLAKADLIRALPVHDVDSGRTVPLESLFPLYSDEWMRTL